MKRTVLLLLLLGTVPILALAQSPKVFSPEKPPRPDEETILNARVAKVDVANRRLTVRGVDVKGEGGPTETFPVVAAMADRLAELRPGMEVLLTLLGQTAIDIKVSAASGGPSGTPVRGTGTKRGAATGRTGTNAAPAAQVIAPSGAAGTENTPGSIVITPSTGAAGTTVAPGTLTNEDLRSGTTSATPTPPPARNRRTTARPPTAPSPRAVASPRPGTAVSPQPLVSPQPIVSPRIGVPVPGRVTTVPGVVLPPGAAPLGLGVGGVIAIGGDPSPSPMGTPFPTPRPPGTPIPVGPRPQISPVSGPSPAAQPTPVPVLVPAAAPTPTPTPSPVS